jgi:hypothetical protein
MHSQKVTSVRRALFLASALVLGALSPCPSFADTMQTAPAVSVLTALPIFKGAVYMVI